MRIILIPFLMVAFFAALGQSNSFENLGSTDFNVISKTNKGTILDVRTPSEYANGNIKGAGQLNFYALDFMKKLLLLPKDEPVYLYCNTGYRSKKAAEILSENGYTRVYNLGKGIMEWNLNELPVVVEPDARPDVEDKMEFDEYQALINSDKPVFIDFYAPWCGPCRKMMPMIDSLKVEYKDKIHIVKVNADASKKLVKDLQLIGVPQFFLYAEGERIFEHSGIISKSEIIELVDNL